MNCFFTKTKNSKLNFNLPVPTTFTLTVLFMFSVNLSIAQMEIYVCDAGNFNLPPWQIVKYDENGENPSTFINTNLDWPQDILFLEDQGVVLISNLNDGTINRHNISDGAYVNAFATGLGGPTRMKIGADGLIYVLQWGGNGKVKRYMQDGTFVDDFTSIGVTNSIGLDWDSDGNLYVSSYSGDNVRKFDTNGMDQGDFISSGLIGPTNIYWETDTTMIVLDYDAGQIKRYGADGNIIQPLVFGLSGPEGVDFLPNGNILIGNGGTGAVKMYDSDFAFIEDLVTPGLGGLIRPNAVVLRDATPTSIQNVIIHAKFVLPTIGTKFRMDQSYPGLLRKVQIFDDMGRMVHKMDSPGETIWDASGFTSGVFFIHGFFDIGTKVQRVVVPY